MPHGLRLCKAMETFSGDILSSNRMARAVKSTGTQTARPRGFRSLISDSGVRKTSHHFVHDLVIQARVQGELELVRQPAYDLRKLECEIGNFQEEVLRIEKDDSKTEKIHHGLAVRHCLDRACGGRAKCSGR